MDHTTYLWTCVVDGTVNNSSGFIDAVIEITEIWFGNDVAVVVNFQKA